MQGNNPTHHLSAIPNRIEIIKGVLKSEPPEAPGVYLFKDITGNVIYVGKAKNLKKRVLSYFKAGTEANTKTALMINRANGLDYVLTSTENEAFILESSMIKVFMPKYNVILRDDKQYPCLRLDVREPFPRLGIVRKIKKDGAVYFGPFSSSNSVRSTLRLIDRIFRLRKCRTWTLSQRKRPCLNFQMGRCLGPCANDVNSSVYGDIVAQVKMFLEGRNNELLRQLEKKMLSLSDMEEYEEAAVFRDQIDAIKRTVERQHVVSAGLEDLDVIGLAHKDYIYQIVIQFIRKGYLTGSRRYSFKDTIASPSEVLSSFIKQYYTHPVFMPKKIFISEQVEDSESLAAWISEITGERISIVRPVRGEKLKMIKMAVSNAEDAITRTTIEDNTDLMDKTREILNLEKTPQRIECMDISNIQGEMAVGAVASFKDGKPDRAYYRNYRIKEIEGINDYGMMAELVQRHLKGGASPDILVIDGGRGHLLTAAKAIEEMGLLERINIISIAKADREKGEKTDKIFMKDRKNPLILKKGHPVLLMLMRIRDEAHRRAVTYHRKVRNNEVKQSKLDFIPGIGPVKKRLLLNKFNDINAISMASAEELSLVKGISGPLAKAISDFFLKKRA